jgi:hypothetical protein
VSQDLEPLGLGGVAGSSVSGCRASGSLLEQAKGTERTASGEKSCRYRMYISQRTHGGIPLCLP